MYLMNNYKSSGIHICISLKSSRTGHTHALLISVFWTRYGLFLDEHNPQVLKSSSFPVCWYLLSNLSLLNFHLPFPYFLWLLCCVLWNQLDSLENWMDMELVLISFSFRNFLKFHLCPCKLDELFILFMSEYYIVSKHIFIHFQEYALYILRIMLYLALMSQACFSGY